jgi:hypothetical protein
MYCRSHEHESLKIVYTSKIYNKKDLASKSKSQSTRKMIGQLQYLHFEDEGFIHYNAILVLIKLEDINGADCEHSHSLKNKALAIRFIALM